MFGTFTFDEIEVEHKRFWENLYTNSDINVYPK